MSYIYNQLYLMVFLSFVTSTLKVTGNFSTWNNQGDHCFNRKESVQAGAWTHNNWITSQVIYQLNATNMCYERN